MKKRDFRKLLNRITTRKRLDIRKIKNLTSEERSDMVHYIVRLRGPIIKDLIPDGFDMSWLNCMGYMYTTKGKQSKYTFKHTCEHSIV